MGGKGTKLSGRRGIIHRKIHGNMGGKNPWGKRKCKRGNLVGNMEKPVRKWETSVGKGGNDLWDFFPWNCNPPLRSPR